MKSKYPQIALGRLGKVNPLSIEDFKATGGFNAFKKSLKLTPDKIIENIEKSGLRGRGGAGFPTGLKQRFASNSSNTSTDRFVVCNADEGEPGTFKDRFIMENDPFLVIEGMLIAGCAINANYGYIYIRGEYSKAIDLIMNAVKQTYANGFLRNNILNSGFSFNIEVFIGAGSYLCGEELTLLESLEGNRGYPRIKPPFPVEKGLWNKPTLVNNVETFSHIPFIINEGYEIYAEIGTTESKGTKLFCVSGNVMKTGVFELPMGITLRQLIDEHCKGMKDGYKLRGVLLGGAAGTFVDDTMLDVPLAYETLKAHGATLGSGAVIVIDESTNLKDLMDSILSFFKHESCGKCIPCRIGTTLLYNRWQMKNLNGLDVDWMVNEAEYMSRNSLCALGQSPVLPLKSFSRYFKKTL